MRINRFFVASCLAFGLNALAPVRSLAQAGSEATREEAPAAESFNLLLKSGLRIQSDAEDIFEVEDQKGALKTGSKVLFVRTSKDEFEIMARGKVEGRVNNKALITIESGSLIKRPLPGDLVVSLGSPWKPGGGETETLSEAPVLTEEPPLPGDPGYLEFTFGRVLAEARADTPNAANAYKQIPTFESTYWRFVWFIEFAWRLGFEAEFFNGSVPTYSYFRREEQTSLNFTRFSVNFRTRKMWSDRLRWTFKAISSSNEFQTTNTDEALIGSVYSGFGPGVRLDYEVVAPTWTSEGGFGVRLQNVFVEADYFPILDAKDTTLSRGTSAGSSSYSWRIGTSLLLDFKWFFWFRRMTLQATMGELVYDLKFTGPTISETGGIYTIPEGGNYKESLKFIFLSVGFRMDDYIGRFFMPR